MAAAVDFDCRPHLLSECTNDYRACSSHFLQQYSSRIRSLSHVLRSASVIAWEVAPDAELHGRVKSLRSTWHKMVRKQVAIEQVRDTLGVRIIVATIQDCYRLVERIHGAFAIVAGEDDDYICNPKPNGYRSLHTTIAGPEGHTVEFQVRTRDMHAVAEWGTAAHRQYKRGRRMFLQNEIATIHFDRSRQPSA